MKSKINLKSILDKYIIVVDGSEEKVVYDVDDSRIFSVHVTGCGRGARNAVLTNNTFKSLKQANKGIDYLNACRLNCFFKAVKVSELKGISEKGYNWLIEDIEDNNRDFEFYKEIENKSKEEARENQAILKQNAIELLHESYVFSIEENEEENIIIITINKPNTK